MKKYLILTAASVLLLMFVTSCDKDGVYNPKEKISKIYYDQEGSKVLSESWTWDKNLLTKVAYGTSQDEYQLFEYDKKQVVKITDYYFGVDHGYVSFIYDKASLSKVEAYNKDNELTESIEVVHDGKKIIKLIMTSYEQDYETLKSVSHQRLLSRALRLFVSKPLLDKMMERIHKSTTYVSTIEFTYDGDNVISEKLIDEDVSYSTAYTYDANINPFYDGLFSSENAMALSVNNPLSGTLTATIAGQSFSSTVTYSYVYDGKWPTEQKTTQTFMGQEFSSSTYYVYLD
ncbi:MAG: hypothetical protein RBS13_03940 [Bacteroidales bacterium]|jgi:hypothetical protein|nr:hypothetical protein [Bacteroidales bacterium]